MLRSAKNFLRTNWLLPVLVLFAVVVYHRWLSFDVFANVDWPFFCPETSAQGIWPSAWQESRLASGWFGAPSVTLWRWPLYFAYGIFGKLGLASNVADPFLVFWPMALSLTVGGYLLVRRLTGSSLGAAVGSLVITYNTYNLAIDTQGHYLLPAAGGLAVMALWLFFVGTDRSRPRVLALSGILLSFSGFADFRIAYVTAWVIVLHVLFTALVVDRLRNPRDRLRRAVAGCMPLGVLVLLNTFWLSASLLTGTLSVDPIMSRLLFGDRYWNLGSALTLFHPFWNGGAPEWFESQPIPIAFWLIPITAFLGAWMNRKRPHVVFFAALALLGIFLTKQSDAPWGEAYAWLYESLPGFGAFREATKFYFLISVGYAVLIGAFVSSACDAPVRNRRWRVGSRVLVVLVAALFAWNAVPVMTGQIGDMFHSRRIPDDFVTANEFLTSQSGYFRTISVPLMSVWLSHDKTRLQIHSGALKSLSRVQYAAGVEQDSAEAAVSEQLGPLLLPFSDRLLDIAAVRYMLVLPEETVDPDGTNRVFLGVRQAYGDELDKIDYLRRLDIGTDDLLVYENAGARPLAYLTRERETLAVAVPYREISPVPVSSSEYRVQVRGLDSSAFLNFSEKFHGSWKLRVGRLDWFGALFRRGYFLPDNLHSENLAGFNSFEIGPDVIRRYGEPGQYVVNADGSVDAELTLYFLPQGFLMLGLVVSGSSFAGLVAYLLFSFRRRKRVGLTGGGI